MAGLGYCPSVAPIKRAGVTSPPPNPLPQGDGGVDGSFHSQLSCPVLPAAKAAGDGDKAWVLSRNPKAQI